MHGKLENPVVKEVKKQRWYQLLSGRWAPSVTTVLARGFPVSYGLMNWFKNSTPEQIEQTGNVARTQGTLVHSIAERWAKEELLNSDETYKIRGLINCKQALNFKIINQEFAVYYDKDDIRVAGRADFEIQLPDGRFGIVDLKRSSGIYPSYEAQVALYTKAMDYNYGLIIQLVNTKKGYRIKEVNIEEGYQAFKAAYQLFKFLGGMKSCPINE